MKRALASCRRVFVLLLLGLIPLALWFYWQAPSLQSMKPALERYIQQQMQLKELHLGALSWRWVGVLWVRAEQVDFAGADDAIAYHNGEVSLRIPLSALYRGELQPDRIRFSGGELSFDAASGRAPIPAERIELDGVDLAWRYGDWRGRLANLSLDFDRFELALEATAPALNISARFSDDGLPQRIQVNCQHTEWLPAEMAARVQGSPTVDLSLTRSDDLNWHAEFAIDSGQPVTLLPGSIYAVELNRLQGELDLKMRSLQPLQPEQIDIAALHWSLNKDAIEAAGRWRDGVLHLSASSGQLPMPMVWSWLRPLGGADWQHWLSLMHSGRASAISGSLDLDWPEPFNGWPDADALGSMRYRLQAQVADADLALGISEDALQHSRVQVDLNQDGLHADFLDTELPRHLGHSSGTLDIPWGSLDLKVSGRASADVAALLNWFGPGDIAGWQWKQSRTQASYRLVWNLADDAPKEAAAELVPDGVWQVALYGMDLKLSDGKVLWQKHGKLKLVDMKVRNNFLETTLSLQANDRQTSDQQTKWRISSLNATGRGLLKQLADQLQLPISHADGAITATLSYDGVWRGTLDLQHSSWQRLLGSAKKRGEPLLLSYQGELDMGGDTPLIRLQKLASKGDNFKLYEGTATISRDGLEAKLSGVHTPSFSGAVDISIPFDDTTVWKIGVDADYLNRNALPEMFEHSQSALEKHWLLHADIDRFDWDDARMSGVHMRLSSDLSELGAFEAAQIHTTQMDILDVDARFTLPGEGRVELRKFSASLEKQHLEMSATLTPEAAGGMRWQGFAALAGDFGHLMEVSGLSERFVAGSGHILFSGSGVMLRKQPWWQGLDGRLRLRVDDGRILEGGTLTTLLSAINLSKLPALLMGQRADLRGPGIMYERLQMEAIMQNQEIRIRNVAMRSSAFDLVGHGRMDIARRVIDLYLIARPLQNLDALLAKIPLLRDVLGGASRSLLRKVYHMHGPFTDAAVESVTPEEAGLASKGLIEHLFALPNAWFGAAEQTTQSGAEPQ